jgi:hypothetical protein
MHLPRWLIVTLLSASVLAVLGYGVWWWSTWPERTLNQFLALGRAGNWTALSQICICNGDPFAALDIQDVDEELDVETREFYRDLRIVGSSASPLDVMMARRQFRLKYAENDQAFSVYAERGRVDLRDAM